MTTLVLRLRAWLLSHPLLAPLLAGALVRLISALVGVGFHARDDYFHVLEPALRWAADPSFDWDSSDVPGAGIRSHLVPRLVWLLVRFGQSIGIEEPTTLLQFIYLVIGAYSLSLVPLGWLAGRRLLDEHGARWTAWLMALYFVLPYAGTRLLIEAMAMVPLLAGVWLSTSPKARALFAAGVTVGLACWFRFQVGVAAVGLAAALGYVAWREAGGRAAAGRVAAYGAGGLVAVGAQGLFDLAATGVFLGPVWRNIAVNLDPPAELSRSSPFVYLGLWLLLTVPPATVVVLPGLVRAGRKLPLVAWPFLTFLLFHSFVAHKEDRFMLPVLPLFILLLVAAPAALREANTPRWQVLASFWPRTRIFLVAVHLAALLVAITSQSQANLRQAMQALRHDAHARAVISLGPELQLFFLGRADLPARRSSRVDAGWLDGELAALQAAGTPANRFLAFAPDRARVEILLAALGLQCDQPRVFRGYWFDRVLTKLNPKRNRRRAPVLLWACEPPALAARSAAPTNATE